MGVSKKFLFSSYLFVLIHFLQYFVNVLDMGCGEINVQLYVGCCVFEVVKSYLCVSVPVLDDNCGALVCSVYDDGIMFLLFLPFSPFLLFFRSWGLGESLRVDWGVFFRSLSITFCLSMVLRLSLVLWTKSVNSCLSLSNNVQFFISCVISVLIRAEFSSILLTSSLLILIAAESRESAASFSASHHT